MGSFGGDSAAGGTATFGGDESPERRYFELYKRFAGRGAVDTSDESKVFTRWLQGRGDMGAVLESEAIKQARESVPCQAIDQLSEWEAAMGVARPGVMAATKTRQMFLQMIMNFVAATPNIKRIETAVARVMDASLPGVGGGGGLGVEGFENTGATAIGDDGIKHFCVLVPSTVNMGYGVWLTKKAQRQLYRGLEAALQIIAPAGTHGAIATSDAGTSPNAPEFYTDGWNGCACDKDVVGS